MLEHVLSEELEELIAARLGDPTIDPHGDPIPTAEFGIEERATHSLDEARSRRRRALRSRLGLRPGDAALPRRERHHARRSHAIIDRQPFGGPVFVRFGDAITRSGALSRARCGSRPRRVSSEPLRPDPVPVFEGAVEGASIALPGELGGTLADRAHSSSSWPKAGSRHAGDARPGVRSVDRTSTRATSPPTCRAGRSSAICCCGSCSRRT